MIHATVQRWLEEHTPIERSLLDGAGLEMLISERLAELGGGESAYVAELSRSSDEVDRLLAAVAVPETWLFRYPRSYDLLLEFLRDRLAAGASGVRLLSVGCATGQEAYCMAMTAAHAGWPAERVHVEGVDRNAGFLSVAERGEYGASSVRTEIPAWAVPFLRRSGERVAVDPGVRGMVRFSRADVTSPGALRGTGPWDAVFCRNLLIYLNVAARERLLEAIGAELAPDGLLFVGHAEQVIRCAVFPLRAVAVPHAFALRPVCGPAPAEGKAGTERRAVARGAARAGSAPERRVTSPVPAAAPAAPGIQRRPDESMEEARYLADAGRAGEAETMIRGLVSRHGPSAPAMELLGMIRMSVNDREGAKRLFEQAVYLEPGRAGALLQLALISELSGDERRATSYWDRARRASSSGREGHGL